METAATPEFIQFIDALKHLGVDITVNGAISLASIAPGVAALFRLFRMPFAQNTLAAVATKYPWAKALVWDEWPEWAQWLSPLVVSLLVGGVTAAAGGAGIGTALGAAVVSWLGAIGIHTGTKQIGHAATPMTSKLPYHAREAISLVVPLNRDLIPK